MAPTTKKAKAVRTLDSVSKSAKDHPKTTKGVISTVYGRESKHTFLNVTRGPDGALVIKEMQPSTAKANVEDGAIYHRNLRIGGDDALVREWYESQESNVDYDTLFSNDRVFTIEDLAELDVEIQANKDFNAANKTKAPEYTQAQDDAFLANIMAWSAAISTLQMNKAEKASTSKAKGKGKGKASSTKTNSRSYKRGVDNLVERYNNVLAAGKYLKVTDKFDASKASGLVQDLPPKTETAVNQGKVWHVQGYNVFSPDKDSGRAQVLEVLGLMGIDDVEEPRYEKIGVSKRRVSAKGKAGSRPTSPEPSDMSVFL